EVGLRETELDDAAGGRRQEAGHGRLDAADRPRPGREQVREEETLVRQRVQVRRQRQPAERTYEPGTEALFQQDDQVQRPGSRRMRRLAMEERNVVVGEGARREPHAGADARDRLRAVESAVEPLRVDLVGETAL